MKISLLAPLAVAAVVNAVPLRVIVVSSGNGTLSHAGHGGDGPGVAQVANYKVHGGPMMRPSTPEVLLHAPENDHKHPHHHHKGPHPCPMKGGKFRTKLTSIANTFRGAFGLPLIEMGEKIEGTIHGGVIHVTSAKVVGGPLLQHDGPSVMPIMLEAEHPGHHHHHPHHVGHHGHAYPHDSSFLQRVHVALMTLGPWEGRAVAFVLGCGLGVLFRTIYVLAVISYRVLRGRSSSEEEPIVEYTHVIYEYQDDAEEIAAPPPPQYSTPADEKAPLEESK